MNARARALAQSNWTQHRMFNFTLTKQGIIMLLLVVAVLASAFAVIYVKTLNRRLFSNLQTEQTVHDQLQVQWGQLLLEQSSYATQARIQRIATEELHMIFPEPKNIVVIPERD